MKKKYGVILAAMLATGVIAQTTTNSTPPPLPAPSAGATPTETPTAAPMPAPMPMADESASTNKPPKKVAKKKKAPAKAKKPKVFEAPGAPFIANETAVSKQNNVNVRAQSHINSEVVFRLQKGEEVTVMKEVVLPHPKADEPANWVQIELPPSTPVWVSGKFIDANQNVTPAKLNVRSGPGENYSVVGVLHKGDTVKTIHTKEGWTQIEAPTNSFGFVAAHLLDHKEVAPPVNVTMNNPPPTPEVTPVTGGGGMTVTPATGAPGSNTSGTGPGTGTAMTMPMPAPAPEASGPPPERVVAREGMVGGTVSVQAPTYFELDSLDDGRAIDYLYTTSPNLVLEHWKGKKVLVTGVESLDERWPSTPVLTIQKIQIVGR